MRIAQPIFSFRYNAENKNSLVLNYNTVGGETVLILTEREYCSMSARDYVTLIKGFRHVDVSTRFRFFSNVLNSLLYFFFIKRNTVEIVNRHRLRKMNISNQIFLIYSYVSCMKVYVFWFWISCRKKMKIITLLFEISVSFLKKRVVCLWTQLIHSRILKS